MKKYILLAGILCLGSINANAIPISSSEFDSSASVFTFDGLSQGTTSASDGVLSVSNGVVIPITAGDLESPSYYDGGDSSVIRMDFSSLVSAVGLDFYSHDQDATLSVYDAANILIESFTLSLSNQFECYGYHCGFVGIDVGSNLISFATIDTPLDGNEIVIDNIRYQSASVSEPGSLALFGLALFGLRALRRNKKA